MEVCWMMIKPFGYKGVLHGFWPLYTILSNKKKNGLMVQKKALIFYWIIVLIQTAKCFFMLHVKESRFAKEDIFSLKHLLLLPLLLMQKQVVTKKWRCVQEDFLENVLLMQKVI